MPLVSLIGTSATGWVTTTSTTSTGNIWFDQTSSSTTDSSSYYYAIQRAMLQQQALYQHEQQRLQQLYNRPIYNEPPPPSRAVPSEARPGSAARSRSRSLLSSCLTKQQRQTLDAHGWFEVWGSRSHRRFRISRRGLVGNVDVFEGAEVVLRLCAHCDERLPLDDHLLAQKLTIESDEDRFLQVANVHWSAPSRTQRVAA